MIRILSLLILSLLVYVASFAQGPANDNCANALPVTVGASCTFAAYNNVSATAEPTSVAPNPTCGFYNGGDVWFTFVMPASGHLRIERATLGGADAQLALYSGTCGSFTQLACLQSTANNASININQPSFAGQTIYIRAFGFNSAAGGSFNLCLWEAPIQPNDNCANATPITVGASCSMQSGSNLFATAEPTSVAINPTCGFYSGGDVWYTFTMPASGGLRLEYSRISGIATSFAFYTGTCGSFTEFSCLQNTGNTAAINISRPDLAGQTIYLRAYGFSSNQGGEYNFCLWESPVPSNDNCANATAISVGASCSMQAGTNQYATAEPTSVATNPSCGFYSGGDVWYTFTMPASGGLRLEYSRISGIATSFAFYTGNCGSFTEFSCLQNTGNTAAINISRTDLAGQTIYLRAYGFSSNQGGEYNFCVWEAPVQPNDNCANATPITVGASCSMQSGSNLFATAEPTSVAINPTCGFYSGGDVWYTFTMPASGGLRLEYSRISGIATCFAFYTGTCGSFTEFSCLQNTGNTAAINISRPDLAGQTIYLRAFGYGSNQGGTYNFCLWEAPIPANDNCANATTLPVTPSCVLQETDYRYATAEPTSVATNPSCGFYNGGDVWFTLTMPNSGQLQINRQHISGAQAQLALYSGTCGSFTQLSCLQTPAGTNNTLTFNDPALIGQTLYLRVFGYSSNQGGQFRLCAFNPAAIEWTGAADSLWSNPANWQGGMVPQAGDNVYVPQGTPHHPVLDGNATISKLTMDWGPALIDIKDYNLTVLDDVDGSGTIAANFGRLILTGKTSKTNLSGFKVANVEFNNPNGFQLVNGDLEVTYLAYLTSGVIETDNGKMLNLNDALIAGGKSSAFISGPLRLSEGSGTSTILTEATTNPTIQGYLGNANALFEALVLGHITFEEMDGFLKEAPTGKIGGRYAPVRLEKLDSIPTTFVVEYFDGNFGNNNVGSGLDRMSQQEYWKIDRVAGLGKANVELSFTDGDFSGIAEMDTADLVMARFGGTNWQIANGPRRIRGNATVGAVGAENLNEFGFFTFGSINGINPLAPLLPFIWSGDVSQLWGLPGNWQNNQVPPPGKKVTIPLTTNQPVLDQNRIIETLVIDNNATIQLGNYNLTIQGDIQGRGEILSTDWGRVIVSGKNSKAQLGGVKVSNIEFNNFRGFELSDGDLEVQKLAYLTSGVIETDNGKMLHLNEGLIAGGKSSAYISGPLRATGGETQSNVLTVPTDPIFLSFFDEADALFGRLRDGFMTFDDMDGFLKEAPTGKIGGRYAPVRLEKLDSISTTFVVEYFDGNFGNNNVGSGLDRMSQQEYWKIDRIAGLGRANVEISFRDGDFSGIAAMDTADLVMARFGGTNWQIANGPRRIRGNATVGAVGAENLNEFGFFTFGSINGINPLAPLLPFIWSGDVSQLWGLPGNWQNNQVPPPGKKVTIPLTTNQPVLDQNRIIETLVIDDNATIHLGDYNLTIQGDIQGRGEILSTDWGRVIVSGKNSKAQLGGVKVSNIEFNNFRGFELSDGDLEVQKLAYLTSGVIETDNGKMLHLNDGLIAGGKSSAFIAGPLKVSEGSGTSTILTEATTNPTIQGYLGNANALFEALVLGHMTYDEMDGHLKEAPTGKIGGRYAPVRLEKLDSIPTTFEVEYFDGNFGNNNVGSGLDRMSQQEYWRIDRIAGLGKANIDLSYRDGDYSGIALVDTADLVVVRFTGTNWVKPTGNRRVSGNATVGRVGVTNQNQFGFYTFGSVNGINPLAPILPFIWTGAIDTMWNNPNNWQNNQVPMPGKRVRVAENTTNKFNLDQDRFTEAFIFNGNNRREEQDNIGDFNLTILGDFTGKGNIVSTGGKVTLTEKEGTTQVGGPKIDRLTFNNPLGFTLTDTVTVKQQLEMLNGRVSVSPEAPFVVNAGFTLVTAGPQSHVNGPVLRYSESSGTSTIKSLFVTDKIPTGKDGRYGPCGIENNEDSTAVFRAEYFTGAHPVIATDASLSHISSVEYWRIERLEGSDPADISLYFEDGNYSGIIFNNAADLVVAWYNGTEWTVLPNDKTVSGNQQKGKVTIKDLDVFGYFTFGSVQGINPLNSFSTSVWTGAADNLWSNPLNWADSIVPNGMVNVIIPDSAQNNPLLDINAEVVNITVENGSTLNMELGANLTVNGTISGSDNIAGSEPGYYIGYSFPNAWSTVVAVTICPAGSYCPNGTEIFACEAGYYSSVAGAVACLPCAPGTFAPAQGATACFNCPVGTYQPAEAATECINCSAAQTEATTDCGSCDTELTIAAEPFILLCAGQTQTITVAFDVPVQNLQWFKGNDPVPGATGTSLLLNRWSIGVYTARAICGGQQIVSNPIEVNTVTVTTESGENAHYMKFCSNTSTTLYAPELTGATYQWRERPDGTLVSTTREHTFSGFSGSFDIFVTSPTGCTRSTRVRILIENQNNCPEDTLSSRPLENAKTGIFAGEVQLQFYPNPVKDNYVLYVEGLKAEEMFEIRWYDMSGREVLTKRQFTAVNGQKVEQNIEGLSKGIYLIQVASINHNFTFKVMVE